MAFACERECRQLFRTSLTAATSLVRLLEDSPSRVVRSRSSQWQHLSVGRGIFWILDAEKSDILLKGRFPLEGMTSMYFYRTASRRYLLKVSLRFLEAALSFSTTREQSETILIKLFGESHLSSTTLSSSVSSGLVDFKGRGGSRVGSEIFLASSSPFIEFSSLYRPVRPERKAPRSLFLSLELSPDSSEDELMILLSLPFTGHEVSMRYVRIEIRILAQVHLLDALLYLFCE